MQARAVTDSAKPSHSAGAHYGSSGIRCRPRLVEAGIHGNQCILPSARTCSAAAYTEYDTANDFTVFEPCSISLSGLLDGESPTPELVDQVKSACEHTGFLTVTDHNCPVSALVATFDAARTFFDLPEAEKQRLVVREMRVGRGYEVSSEHQAYEAYVREVSTRDTCLHSALQKHPEPSVRDGLMSERFMCGPMLPPATAEAGTMDPDVKELHEVFFAPNVWPEEHAPALRPCMESMYARCTDVAETLLRVFAVALGAPEDFFADKTDCHHSNMQVANYSSLVVWPEDQGACMRKKAHVDSGTLTILASDDWLGGRKTWQPGDGGLQLLSKEGVWQEVAVPRGALLVNLGSLMTRWTAGRWKSTLHRVTNPRRESSTDSRRMSLAYFHKVNAQALVEVFPSCLPTGAADAGSQALPVRAMDLTRQGIMHKYRHLPLEEASAKYHAELAAMRL